MSKKHSLFSQRPKTRTLKRKSEYPESILVEGFSHEGRGIAKHEGKTLFISGALPGEEVRFNIEQQHRRFDEARCTEVISASTHRVEPGCQYYEQCGGCDLQHLSHAEQITTKQQLVLDQLQRLGGFQPEQIDTPLQSPAWGYRRSCRLGINQLQKDGSALVGFRRKGSSKLIAIEQCPVLAAPLNKILQALPAILETEENFKSITHAELSLGDDSGALCLRVKKPLSDNLKSQLLRLCHANDFHLYLDDGNEIRTVEQSPDLFYRVPESAHQIVFKPGDFIQVNTAINNQMVERAIAWLAPTSTDRVLDLFCGIGNFTLPIAGFVDSIVGVEGIEDMVSRAQQNATRNQLDNCQFYRADLSKELQALPWYKQGFNKILLDPPRAGALEVIQQLDSHRPESILYISCNPAALARDGAVLVEQGYKAARFCVMDMFPHTSHVESMVLFVKSDA